MEGVGAQSKERKGSNFAIWQPWGKYSLSSRIRYHCIETHRLDVLLEPVDVFLEEVQRARLAAVPREGRRARRVDRVHPVLQLDLARRLQGKGYEDIQY